MGVAVFNYAVWAARYPALADTVGADLAQSYFDEAGLYLNNTDCSPVCDTGQRLTLLNMLVAHIASLNGATAAGAAGLVGRVTSATEGSVTISVDLGAIPNTAAWYAQTPAGLSYWQATAGYRSAVYIPGDQPYLGVQPGYGGMAGFGQWPY